MLLSVILPVYNNDIYISKCIDSVLKQTYKNIELICINDGSTDTTPTILEKYSKEDSRIKIINVENGGVSKARNLGLNIAKGDFITFIDSDDTIDRNTYKIVLSKMIECSADACVFGMERVYNNNSSECDLGKIHFQSIDFQTFNNFMHSNKYPVTGIVNNKVYKKTILKNIRFDDKIYIWEDMLFNFLAMLEARKIIYTSTLFYKYNTANENSVSVTSRLTESGFAKMETSLLSCEKMINICMVDKRPILAERGIMLMKLLFTMHELNIKKFPQYSKYKNMLLRSSSAVMLYDGIDLKHKVTFCVSCISIKFGLLCKKYGQLLLVCYKKIADKL